LFLTNQEQCTTNFIQKLAKFISQTAIISIQPLFKYCMKFCENRPQINKN